jgi:hypothetical protein
MYEYAMAHRQQKIGVIWEGQCFRGVDISAVEMQSWLQHRDIVLLYVFVKPFNHSIRYYRIAFLRFYKL